LARTRRRGDNAGMAGDDGRAQVQLDEDTLARRRRDLGEDHPDTLAAGSNLAVSLRAAGEYQAARELDEDTLARRRRVLGEDHPDTLAAAFQLVCALSELGEHHAARELNDDIIARRRRVLGDEHPETIMAGAFDLILRGLDLGGEPEWMAALREGEKRRQQEAREPDS
jgi:Tetratricopeptide repeat